MKVALLVGLSLAGCKGAGHPSTEPRPAFEMKISSRPCSEDEHAAACFDITITNIGGKAGIGKCELQGYVRGSNQPVIGQVFSIRELEVGGMIHREGLWTMPPQDTYAGYCNPGPSG
jgi:hypothetical protein